MGGGEVGAVEGGVVVEREEVIVDVAAGVGGRGEHRESVVWGGKGGGTRGGFAASGEPGDGLEADGFHVAAAFEGVGFAVVFNIVADVGVAAEKLDGGVPLLATDGFEECGVFWRAQGDVAGD